MWGADFLGGKGYFDEKKFGFQSMWGSGGLGVEDGLATDLCGLHKQPFPAIKLEKKSLMACAERRKREKNQWMFGSVVLVPLLERMRAESYVVSRSGVLLHQKLDEEALWLARVREGSSPENKMVNPLSDAESWCPESTKPTMNHSMWSPRAFLDGLIILPLLL